MLYTTQNQIQNPSSVAQSSVELEANQVEAVNQAVAVTTKSVRNVKI